MKGHFGLVHECEAVKPCRLPASGRRPRPTAGGCRVLRTRPASNPGHRPLPAEVDRACHDACLPRLPANPAIRAAATTTERSTSRSRRQFASTAANAAAGEVATVAVRESTRRLPNRTPPQLRDERVADSESDQRVSANSASSLRRARSMASRTPTGFMLNS